MKKLHKQDFKYKFQDKKMEDVTLEIIQQRVEKMSPSKPFRALVKDNGRVIVAFLTSGYYESYSLSAEHSNVHGDTWIQYGNHKVFSFSTEYNNFNIYVAEFWTEEKFLQEEQKMINDYTNAYFNIKEDDGKYSKYDVYSQSELM